MQALHLKGKMSSDLVIAISHVLLNMGRRVLMTRKSFLSFVGDLTWETHISAGEIFFFSVINSKNLFLWLCKNQRKIHGFTIAAFIYVIS